MTDGPTASTARSTVLSTAASAVTQRSARWRAQVLVTLLAAVTIGWAEVPAGPGAYRRIALIAAIVAGIGGAAQLALAGATDQASGVASTLERAAARLVATVQAAPWAELLTVAVVALEAAHRARPWHTAVLGGALFSYLFSCHLAETGATASVLRPQVAVLTAGGGLLLLAVGAAALPATATGSFAVGWQVFATAAALTAAVLATPVWLGSRTDP